MCNSISQLILFTELYGNVLILSVQRWSCEDRRVIHRHLIRVLRFTKVHSHGNCVHVIPLSRSVHFDCWTISFLDVECLRGRFSSRVSMNETKGTRRTWCYSITNEEIIFTSFSLYICTDVFVPVSHFKKRTISSNYFCYYFPEPKRK